MGSGGAYSGVQEDKDMKRLHEIIKAEQDSAWSRTEAMRALIFTMPVDARNAPGVWETYKALVDREFDIIGSLAAAAGTIEMLAKIAPEWPA